MMKYNDPEATTPEHYTVQDTLTIRMSRLWAMMSGSFLAMTSSTDMPLNLSRVRLAFFTVTSASVWWFLSCLGGRPRFFPFSGVKGRATKDMRMVLKVMLEVHCLKYFLVERLDLKLTSNPYSK